MQNQARRFCCDCVLSFPGVIASRSTLGTVSMNAPSAVGQTFLHLSWSYMSQVMDINCKVLHSVRGTRVPFRFRSSQNTESVLDGLLRH